MATARVACGYATTVATTTTDGQSIKTQSIPLLRIILHLLHIYLGALHTHKHTCITKNRLRKLHEEHFPMQFDASNFIFCRLYDGILFKWQQQTREAQLGLRRRLWACPENACEM